MQQQSLNET